MWLRKAIFCFASGAMGLHKMCRNMEGAGLCESCPLWFGALTFGHFAVSEKYVDKILFIADEVQTFFHLKNYLYK